MASSFQGFNKDLNLIETQVDRDFLNNLGGAPISDDIGLFANNNRNFSTLIVLASYITGNRVIFPIETPFIYSEDTEISVLGLPYTIVDKRREDDDRLSFQLSQNGVIVSTPPVGDYLRNNAVSHVNITNLVKDRPLVVEDITKSQLLTSDISLDEIGVDEGNQRDNPYVSYFDIFGLQGYPTNLNGYLSAIDEDISFLDFRRNNSMIRGIDFNTGFSARISGTTSVSDPDGLNNANVSNSNPGLFILNPVTGQFGRAFSNSGNVWELIGNDLVAETREIDMQNLVYEADIKITTNGNNIITSESGNVSDDFTHFTKVIINDEDYFLCVKI